MNGLNPDKAIGATEREKIAQLVYDVIVDSKGSINTVKSDDLIDSVFETYSEKVHSLMILSLVYGDFVPFGKSEDDLCFFEEFPHSKFHLYLSKNPFNNKRKVLIKSIIDDDNNCYINGYLKLTE